VPDRPDYTSLIDVRSVYVTVDTNFQQQAKGVEREPEWRAAKGYEKGFRGAATLPARDMAIIIEYTVPTGKILVLTDWGFSGHGPTDPANPAVCPCHIHLLDYTAGIMLAYDGGQVGRYATLNTPVIIPAGHTFRMLIYSNYEYEAVFEAAIRGFEYEVAS